jgi:PAS domain S-box-containing protein
MNRDVNVHFSPEATEQEQVELSVPQHLSLQTHMLRTMHVEHISHAFIALDHQWRMMYVSHQASYLLERTREALLGNVLWEVFPESVNTLLYRYCHQAAADGRPVQFEVKSPQQEKSYLLHIFPSEDEMAIFLSDITAHKQAEEQLQFQANILRNVRDSVIVLNLQGHITYWNEGATSIFGYTAEDTLGKAFTYFFPELYETQLIKDLETIIAGQDYTVEWKTSRRDGSTIWLDTKITLLYNSDGEFSGFIGVSKDITERKLAEAELHAAKEQLEAILHNINDGIVVHDAYGKIIYANQAVAKMTGYPSVEALLQAPPPTLLDEFDLIDEFGHRLLAAEMPGRRALKGEKNPQINLRMVRKDSRIDRWIRLTSTVVSARDQLPTLVITVVQDITQFKELEQRKDDFILHVNHELRTPLTALVGFLELLHDHYNKIDQQTRIKFFHQGLENCHELIRLVNSIMDASHFANTLHPSQPEDFSLAQVVREVLAQLEPSMQQTHPLAIQVPEQLLVRADRQGVEQIVRNLLTNAFKYAPPGTPVTISAGVSQPSQQTTASQEVCVCVQDSGPGIPPLEQSLLFQKFTRLQRDISGSIRGTGLGLYICKQLVESMGGRIWIESSGQPGEGSRFCFTLPLLLQTSPAAQ